MWTIIAGKRLPFCIYAGKETTWRFLEYVDEMMEIGFEGETGDRRLFSNSPIKSWIIILSGSGRKNSASNHCRKGISKGKTKRRVKHVKNFTGNRI